MTKQIIHVIGTGTIGEPLISLLLKIRKLLNVDYEVSFSKFTPRSDDRSKVQSLISEGAVLAVEANKRDDFQNLGIMPVLEFEEAMNRASVIIDCTSKSGNIHKEKYFKKLENNTLGFLAQGSEKGFGKPYAYNITDGNVLEKNEKYTWIVSCNTHNVSVVIWTIALNFGRQNDNLLFGDFTLMRRATDINQPNKNFVPAPEVGKHNDSIFGTHQAKDAAMLFEENFGLKLNLFSSAAILPSQFMHVMRFSLELKESLTLPEVLNRIKENPLVAVTEYNSTANVYSFGRDHGHYGRILSQTVVPVQTLSVYGNKVVGFCFTPQDGNSLLSSVAAALRFLHPKDYLEMMSEITQTFTDKKI